MYTRKKVVPIIKRESKTIESEPVSINRFRKSKT